MKLFFGGFIWLLGILLGIISMVFSFLTIGFITSNIILLCIISVIIGFLVILAMSKLSRIIKGKKSKSYSPIFTATIIVLIFSLFCNFTFFKPLPGAIIKADIPENTKYWELSTGSKIAYWHYPANAIKKPTPILFLHGGPGAFIRDLERNFFSKFTKEGYDVYLYDQPGAGFSDSLKMNEYTINRYVEDIEAIRKKIGSEKIIIIGQSFGGVLGSSYVSKYPKNVKKIVFTSPGELGIPHTKEQYDKPRNAAELIEPFEIPFQEALRIKLVQILDNNINVKTGENLISQKEIRDYSTRLIYDAVARSYPPSYVNKLPKLKYGGLNLHSNFLLNADLIEESDKIKKDIIKVKVPTLILRGEYDYVSWKGTLEYNKLYPNSKLVYIKNSGHILWGVNEKDTYNIISDFLLNKDLSLPVYIGDENPSKNK